MNSETIPEKVLWIKGDKLHRNLGGGEIKWQSSRKLESFHLRSECPPSLVGSNTLVLFIASCKAHRTEAINSSNSCLLSLPYFSSLLWPSHCQSQDILQTPPSKPISFRGFSDINRSIPLYSISLVLDSRHSELMWSNKKQLCQFLSIWKLRDISRLSGIWTCQIDQNRMAETRRGRGGKKGKETLSI